MHKEITRELVTLTPFAFGDLNDNDNNVDLCFRDFGVPVMIEVDASTVVDPNGDPIEFLSFGGIQ